MKYKAIGQRKPRVNVPLISINRAPQLAEFRRIENSRAVLRSGRGQSAAKVARWIRYQPRRCSSIPEDTTRQLQRPMRTFERPLCFDFRRAASTSSGMTSATGIVPIAGERRARRYSFFAAVAGDHGRSPSRLRLSKKFLATTSNLLLALICFNAFSRCFSRLGSFPSASVSRALSHRLRASAPYRRS